MDILIDLANQTGKDLWYCVPHQANDAYVRKALERFRNRLNPQLKVYLEYSNEVWNGGFSQYFFADEMGTRLGLSNNGWEAGRMYGAHRTNEIAIMAEQVFGNLNRTPIVLAGQMWEGPIDVAVKYAESKGFMHRISKLAMAPYFGKHYDLSQENVTVDQVIADTRAHIQTGFSGILAYRALADRHPGVELLAYEGGQHLTGDYSSAKLTATLTAVNRDPRMYELYRDYLNRLDTEFKLELFEHFLHMEGVSQFGYWGSVENRKHFQDWLAAPTEAARRQTAPKYQALQEKARAGNAP